MRPKLDYDFSEFRNILFDIKTNGATASRLNELKSELNSFFRDSKCLDVLYTDNTDKLFFGMAVIPKITGDDAIKILQSDDHIRLNQYYLELDSKLFSPILNMNTDELIAILLHEVGHVVNDSKPVEQVRTSVDTYLMKNNEHLVITDSIHYREILAFAIKDTVRKYSSIFEKEKDEEIIADEFVATFGYGHDLESAFDKIVKNGYNINRNVNNKLIVLSWVLRLYKDVKLKRISALRALNKGKSMTPSRLEKREIDNVMRRLNRIDDEALIESAVEGLKAKYNATIKQIKYKGIRAFEDDLYEYNMRIRNIEDEDDALYILRQINTRLAIIDDYVSTENLDEKEQKRWFDLMDKFRKLRDDLSKKTVYRNRSLGVLVQYPDIVPNRY